MSVDTCCRVTGQGVVQGAGYGLEQVHLRGGAWRTHVNTITKKSNMESVVEGVVQS